MRKLVSGAPPATLWPGGGGLERMQKDPGLRRAWARQLELKCFANHTWDALSSGSSSLREWHPPRLLPQNEEGNPNT